MTNTLAPFQTRKYLTHDPNIRLMNAPAKISNNYKGEMEEVNMNPKKRWRRIMILAAGIIVLAFVYNTVSAQRNLYRSAQLKVEEESYLSYFYQAYSKLNLGDFKGAIDDFNRAEELNPWQGNNINIGRGFAYLQNGDFDLALSEFDQALVLDPNSADAYFYRGLLYFRMGDYDKAVADYDQAIALGGRVESYFNRGTALILKGQMDQGLMDYMQGFRVQGSMAQEIKNQ